MQARHRAPAAAAASLLVLAFLAAACGGETTSDPVASPASDDAPPYAPNPNPVSPPDPDPVACPDAAPPVDPTSVPDCGAIEFIPPVLTVVNAATGSPICDPTFAIDSSDAGASDVAAVDCSGGTPYGGCPAPPSDGGVAPCQYALLGLSGQFGLGTSSFTIDVSKSGFQSVTVPDVVTGVGGCVAFQAASQVTVKLTPLVDSGAPDAAGD
jgi:hypothetical protein